MRASFGVTLVPFFGGDFRSVAGVTAAAADVGGDEVPLAGAVGAGAGVEAEDWPLVFVSFSLIAVLGDLEPHQIHNYTSL